MSGARPGSARFNPLWGLLCVLLVDDKPASLALIAAAA